MSAHHHPFSAASVKATFNESLSLVRALSKHCEKFAKLMMKLSTYKNSNHIFRKFHLEKKVLARRKELIWLSQLFMDSSIYGD